MHLYRKLVSRKVDSGNENDLESEIDQLLRQLQQVNSQMQAWVSSGGSEIFSHTLTRHQEILHDLTQVMFLSLFGISLFGEYEFRCNNRYSNQLTSNLPITTPKDI